GSLGLDLAAAVRVSLHTTQPVKVPSGVTGPIVINGNNVGGLLLGRSSMSLMGLFVLPGVIDADYAGEIMIMVYTLYPPITIEKGQRIAQLVPLPQLTKPLADHQPQRGNRGFGSTGATLLVMDLKDRPRSRVDIQWQGQTITLTGLLDTGADTSIVS
ncbi:hypothetical protein N311_00064, partial [Apaloderma vittatum]